MFLAYKAVKLLSDEFKINNEYFLNQKLTQYESPFIHEQYIYENVRPLRDEVEYREKKRSEIISLVGIEMYANAVVPFEILCSSLSVRAQRLKKLVKKKEKKTKIGR